MTVASVDVLIVGAGAAGMMCAIEAGRRGRRVRIVDHGRAPGEKIRISGGGRCNFTNLGTTAAQFLGENPRFATSALKRFTPGDFIARVDAAGIGWHEKNHNGRSLGQLFCDDSARQIIAMLTGQMREAGATLSLGTAVRDVRRDGDRFRADLSDGSVVSTQSLVLATGGKSIPKMGATGWAYDTARSFGLRVTETRPALVPLTFEAGLLDQTRDLAGVSVDAVVTGGGGRFAEGLLFTHRGLSGPSILQISSYWREGGSVTVDLAPGIDVFAEMKALRAAQGRLAAHNALARLLPRRLAEAVNRWTVRPAGSEGYRTAEVTLGGVDTAALDQKTMQARAMPGLYVIGEAVDVTGWLGGYNFQWAWSSGWAAGQAC